MRVLINASNLHLGGGVQVAASLIYEFSQINCDIEFSIICSTEVFDSIPLDIDISVFHYFKIINVYGFLSYNKLINKISRLNDISLTVFGPCYFKLKSKVNIVGFAQPWIIYNNNPLYDRMSLFYKLKTKAKFNLQKMFFKCSDKLVVEHKSVRDSLLEKGFKVDDLFVINNTVSAPFFDESLRYELKVPLIKESLVLGFLGRAYPHKNISIIKDVSNILKEKYNIDIGFLFSLTDDEMKELSFDSIDNFYTCGTIKSTQCPDFYKAIDGLIFPSLLECFSASPLEAMVMKKIIFASNYPFIKNVYGNAIYYFDPLNAGNIAEVIAQNINQSIENTIRVRKGIEVSKNIITAKERAVEYVNLFYKI